MPFINIKLCILCFCFIGVWCWLHFTIRCVGHLFCCLQRLSWRPLGHIELSTGSNRLKTVQCFHLLLISILENAVVMLNFWQLSILHQTTANVHPLSKQNDKVNSIHCFAFATLCFLLISANTRHWEGQQYTKISASFFETRAMQN